MCLAVGKWALDYLVEKTAIPRIYAQILYSIGMLSLNFPTLNFLPPAESLAGCDNI
jgi:hypothetical protein